MDTSILCVMHPFIPGVNLGETVYKFVEIKRIFHKAYLLFANDKTRAVHVKTLLSKPLQ